MKTGDNVPVWKYSTDTCKPVFSTRNTWYLIRSSAPTGSWYESTWFQHSTPKYAFITWLATHNRLTTGNRMLLWNTNIDAGCVLCNQHLEIRNHLFFECTYSYEIWKGLLGKLLLSCFTHHWQDILVLLADHSYTTKNLFLLRYSFQVAIHSIWRERNNRRHGSQPIPADRLVQIMDRQIRNQCLPMISKKLRRYEEVLQVWLSGR